MTIKRLVGLSLLTVALSACGVTGKPSYNAFSNQALPQIAEGQSVVVLYRDQSGDAQAINIAINGEYQASLQKEGYTALNVCAKPQRLGAYASGSDAGYMKKRNDGQFYSMAQNAYTYLRVSVNEMNQAVLTPVDEATAKSEMQAGKYQSNTLSRVQNGCADYKFVVDASALFPLDQYAANTILPNGLKEIGQVAAAIRSYPEAIRGIEVTGHTDPVGDAAYNDTLSQRRAETVRQLLARNGVPAQLIHATGRGERDLVVQDCQQKYQSVQEVTACNQPNRRVEIKLHPAN